MKGLIAIIDALGVSTYSIEQSKNFLNCRNEIISKVTKVAGFVAKVLSKENYIPSIYTFGDTLIVSWRATEDESDKIYGTIWTGTWLRYLLVLGLHQGLLFRGSMAYGEYISEENTILGPAVADAASWYESADWFGVICAPSMQFSLNSLVSLQDERKETASMLAWFLRYDVPMKGSTPKRLWTIPWPYDIWSRLYRETNDKNTAKEKAKRVMNSLLEGQAVPKGTEDKYKNSLAYFDHCTETYSINEKKINDMDVYLALKGIKKEPEEDKPAT